MDALRQALFYDSPRFEATKREKAAQDVMSDLEACKPHEVSPLDYTMITEIAAIKQLRRTKKKTQKEHNYLQASHDSSFHPTRRLGCLPVYDPKETAQTPSHEHAWHYMRQLFCIHFAESILKPCRSQSKQWNNCLVPARLRDCLRTERSVDSFMPIPKVVCRTR